MRLDTSRHRRLLARKSAPCSSDAPPARMCIVWVDRHVHKNGGTSMRRVVRHLTKADAVQQIGGWDAAVGNWRAFMNGIGSMVEPCSEKLRQLRIGLETHEGMSAAFTSQWFEAIRRLRRTPHACCRVVVSLRVREPLSHYLSAFQWGALDRLPFRSHDGTLCTRPDPARCNASSTFAWWAPPNLQAQLLSRGDLPLADGYLWPQALQPTVNPAWRPYGRSAFNRTLHARSSGLTLTHTDVHLTLTHTLPSPQARPR